MSTRYLGDLSVHEAAEGGSVQTGIGTIRTTVVKTGKYDELLESQPVVGTEHIIESTLTGKRGGMGSLTYVREIKSEVPPDPDEPEDSTPLKITHEITWQQVEKPLLTHPDADITISMSNADPAELSIWMNEPDPALKLAFKFGTPGEVVELSAKSKEFAALINKGVESYLTFVPIISRVSICSDRPATGGCGLRYTPAQVKYAITELEYLKTADSVQQNADNTWTRTEQWTGMKEWSAVLYGAAPA